VSPAPAHLVFVDFENVPTFDLDSVAQLPVFVTVLIGKTQTKLDMSLVLQVARHAAKMELIQTGASGRNALDLILAFHLGQAAARSPGATLHVISKDKDFDPLLAHLSSTGVPSSRSESFAELPFVRPAAPPAVPKKRASPRRKSTGMVDVVPAIPPAMPDPVMEKIIAHLRTDGGPRPKRKNSLLRHIANCYGNRLTEPELGQKLNALTATGLMTISSDGKVGYLSSTGAASL